jgi:hypothetical protein
MTMAPNRRRPRARRWTLEDLDREQAYRLHFDPVAFRWEVVDQAGEAVVTRVHINRRSAYAGDRLDAGAERTQPAPPASEAPAVSGGSTAPALGRHRATIDG